MDLVYGGRIYPHIIIIGPFPRTREFPLTNQSECRLISGNLLVANESVKLMQEYFDNPIIPESSVGFTLGHIRKERQR